MSFNLARSDGPDTSGLSSKEKAAIVVRLILADGEMPILSSLPDAKQTELALQIARMASIDTEMVNAVAGEFADAVERIGLSFPQGLEGTLGLLDGIISPSAQSRLRKMSPSRYSGDPWEQVGAVETERLLPYLEAESIEVAAVILSKLTVAKASELISKLPGERARRLTYTISLTGSIAPGVVHKIGIAMAEQLETRPARAFADGPVARVGAILNRAPASTRDEVLSGLDAEDAAFAEQVRKAIFTFAHIPERVSPRDVPRIQRDISQDDLTQAVAVAEGGDKAAVDFLLANISQRLAESIRAAAADGKKPKKAEAEAAMLRIVSTIRDLESQGEIFLVAEEEE